MYLRVLHRSILTAVGGLWAMMAVANGYDFVLLTKEANNGDVQAQMMLADYYGQSKELTNQFYWMQRVAEQNHAQAQFNLGQMYRQGIGVRQDFAQAFAWYAKAAEQNHAQAQFNLGVMYYLGQGVPQNYALAKNWMGRACEQGHQQACHNHKTLELPQVQ